MGKTNNGYTQTGLIVSSPLVTGSNSKNLYALARDILAATNNTAAKSFLKDLPPTHELVDRGAKASDLSIVDALNDLGPTAPETSTFVAAILSSAPDQCWRQPYEPEDFGADFAARSGWFAIADRDGPLVMTEGLVEIMLLDAKLKYPMHSHAPEELYLVLAGGVWWESEGSLGAPSWRKAGDVIHHHPHIRHALTAGEKPALLLALWRGGGFEKPAIG